MFKRIKTYFNKKKTRIKNRMSRIHPPGLQGMDLYAFLRFFAVGLKRGKITSRASSVAYKFFIALIPAILFVLCFIPYVPIEGFQERLITLIQEVFPPEIYLYIEQALMDVLTVQRPDLLSFGFLMALFFSVNGMHSVMRSFDDSYHKTDNRSDLIQYLISLLLVFILAFLVILIIASISLGENFLQNLIDSGILQKKSSFLLLKYGKWLLLALFVFVSIALVYYLAPSHKKKFKEIIPGAVFSTIFSLIITLGLNYFISNLARFNEFFGSIGTLIATLLWIYYNSIILLLGFEFNISIVNAKNNKAKNN